MLLRLMIRSPLLLIGSMRMSIVTCPALAFLPLLLMPVELAAVVWTVTQATPQYTRVQQQLDRLNEVMEENLAGVRVVKAFVRARHEKARFGHANPALTEQSIQAARTVAIMPALMMLTMNLGILGALWFGGIKVTQGQMLVGQIIAFANYLRGCRWLRWLWLGRGSIVLRGRALLCPRPGRPFLAKAFDLWCIREAAHG